MGELINKILKFLGLKDNYKQLYKAYESDQIVYNTILTGNNNEYYDNTMEINNQDIDTVQINQQGNTNFKNQANIHRYTKEREDFQNKIRFGLDIAKIQKEQEEIGKKYSVINEEHFTSMGINANININNSRIMGGTIDLDRVNITDSELKNVKTYRGSEVESGR